MIVLNRHVKFTDDQYHIKGDILDQKIKVEKKVLALPGVKICIALNFQNSLPGMSKVSCISL